MRRHKRPQPTFKAVHRKGRHVLELNIQRGVGLWLNGKGADKEWAIVGGTGGEHVTSGLTIGKVPLTRFIYHGAEEHGIPKVGGAAAMMFGDRLFAGKIVKACSGYNEDRDRVVRLHGGRRLSIDITHLYVKMVFPWEQTDYIKVKR